MIGVLVVLVFGWILQIGFWLAALLQSRQAAAARGEWLRELTLRMTMMALLGWALLAALPKASSASAPAPGITLSALLAFGTGQTLAIVARMQLGRGWTIGVHPRTGRATAGVYRFIRHPIYTGMIIALMAQAVLLRDIASLVLLIGAVIVAPLKATLESRKLWSSGRNENT